MWTAVPSARPLRTRRRSARPSAHRLLKAKAECSAKEARSLWIQVIDCGLITLEDILINRQVPEEFHFFPSPYFSLCSLCHLQQEQMGNIGHSTVGQVPLGDRQVSGTHGLWMANLVTQGL